MQKNIDTIDFIRKKSYFVKLWILLTTGQWSLETKTPLFFKLASKRFLNMISHAISLTW